jgi:hypothetical protein
MKYYNTRNDMILDYCKPGSKICEIGVFCGEFAQKLLETNPEKLVLIDPWQGIVGSGNVDGNNYVECDLEKVYEHLFEKSQNIPIIDLRRGYSGNILEDYPDNFFDFIYIDGDHSYYGCKLDLNLSWKKVKPGGVIAGHDYEMNMKKAQNYYNFGVKDAVDEFCRNRGLNISAKAIDGCVSYAIEIPNIKE